jgi:hypothetical protein
MLKSIVYAETMLILPALCVPWWPGALMAHLFLLPRSHKNTKNHKGFLFTMQFVVHQILQT